MKLDFQTIKNHLETCFNNNKYTIVDITNDVEYLEYASWLDILIMFKTKGNYKKFKKFCTTRDLLIFFHCGAKVEVTTAMTVQQIGRILINILENRMECCVCLEKNSVKGFACKTCGNIVCSLCNEKLQSFECPVCKE